MASLKSVQSGSVVLGTSATSVTATITAVDTAKAFLRFTKKGDGDHSGLQYVPVAGTISSGTQLTFLRQSTTGTPLNITIEWQVIEYNSGVSVQRGSVTSFTANTDKDVSISSVNTAKTFVFLSTYGTHNWGVGGDSRFTAQITSSTNLRLREYRTSISSVNTCYYEIVQYDNCTVTQYYKAVSSGTSNSIAITSVNMARTILSVTFGSDIAGDASYTTSFVWDCYLSGSTTITMNKNASGNNDYFRVFVIEFTENTVYRYSESFSTSDTSKNTTISAVTTSRSFINCTGTIENSSQGINGDALTWGGVMTAAKFNSSTQVNSSRYASKSLSGTYYFEVLSHTGRKKDFFPFFAF